MRAFWRWWGVLVAVVVVGVAWGDDKQPEWGVYSSAPDTASATFASGLFITRGGNVVEPPLTLRLAGDTLLLNDQYVLVPDPGAPAAPHAASPRFEPQSEPSRNTIHGLVERVGDQNRDLFMAGRSTSEVLAAAEAMLEASPLVAGAEQMGCGSIWIQFYDPERRNGLLDIHMQGIGPPRFGPQPRPEYSRSTFTELSSVLGRGGVVMYHRMGRRKSCPASSAPAIRECIAELRAHGMLHEPWTECASLLSGFQVIVLNAVRKGDH